MHESHDYEKKSYRKAFGKTADHSDLAKTCVCLANARGGTLLIGIEDDHELPPPDQRIDQEDANRLLQALAGRCLNVGLADPQIITSPNGGEHLQLRIHPSISTIATTADGRVYMRLGEQCRPVVGEDLLRLASEKSGFQWELQAPQRVTVDQLNPAEIKFFLQKVREAPSDKVSPFEKSKSDNELLAHYNLVREDGQVTNLGILWLGTPAQRARLRYGLIVQYMVYDEAERRIRKEIWLDHQLNPLHLLEDILTRGVELHYYHEVPNGIYRRQVRRYPEAVLRELLANAFAHRLYTTGTDVAIRVYPDRLEVESPGHLPLGVTPTTILHERVRRNQALMETFQATGLMEGEGSGYDLIYEKLSRDAKPLPEIDDTYNNLRVIIQAKAPNPTAVALLDTLARYYEFRQKEIITLGIIAQRGTITAPVLAQALQLRQEERLRTWLGRLLEWDIVLARGVKKGTEYMVNPKAYAAANLDVKPSLKTLEPHRLRALIAEDLKAYPNSLMSEIHRRLEELSLEDIRKEVYRMVADGTVGSTDGKTYRRYFVLP
ncbi:ATP-binding protein [Hymenobacter saemangeumensis]|uniref:ATP-binding protein n=1 Tax=Hymenobacter saemangeumensis TaxID=1084522 RepID=A0ABP8IH87_9BACT